MRRFSMARPLIMKSLGGILVWGGLVAPTMALSSSLKNVGFVRANGQRGDPVEGLPADMRTAS